MNQTPLVRDLIAALGDNAVKYHPADLMVFEYDGSLDGADERIPADAAVFPASTDDVSAIVRIARRHHRPIVPRGAGTGLSGGTVPIHGGIVVSLTRMDRILAIHPAERTALVEAGVVNLELSAAVRPHGLTYAPDPSSQKAATIGGNIGENAGGPHCLRYGVTTNHILGLEVVLDDGSVIWIDAADDAAVGPDLTSLIVGSEGTLAIVTRALVRLTPLPATNRVMLTAFSTLTAAASAVTDLIRNGIVPTSLEMVDHNAIQAIEAANHAGYPTDAAAVLLIEVDGHPADVEAASAAVRRATDAAGAMLYREADTPDAQALLWKGRRMALASFGRLAPNYYLQDASVPRTRLVEALEAVGRIAAAYNLPVANMFHAGDGNLHPVLLFDAAIPGTMDRVLAASHHMVAAFLALGGTLSGEHGIGTEKRGFMDQLYAPDDLATYALAKRALDETALFNPHKIFPATTPSGAHDR